MAGITRMKIVSLSALLAARGTALGTTAWVAVDRAHVARFTEAMRVPGQPDTGEPDDLPGCLVLALAATLVRDLVALDDVDTTVIAGVRGARFAAPVRVGSRLRAHVVLQDAMNTGRFVQAVFALTYEAAPPTAVPPCAAEIVLLFHAAATPAIGHTGSTSAPYDTPSTPKP